MRFIHSGEELCEADHLPSNVRIAGGFRKFQATEGRAIAFAGGFHRDFSVAAPVARG
jgi:hypothetical protein